MSEYHSKVEVVASDGTHMLLWVSACHNTGLNSFSASYHNYCMESWSFQPVNEGIQSNGNSPIGNIMIFVSFIRTMEEG